MVNLGYLPGSQGDWLDHEPQLEFGWWFPPSAEQLVFSTTIFLMLVLICPDKPSPRDSLSLGTGSHNPRESGHMGNPESECSSPFLTAPEAQMLPSVLTKKVRRMFWTQKAVQIQVGFVTTCGAGC